MTKSNAPEFKFSGDLLKIRRKLLNYSLKEVGIIIGVTNTTIRNWEIGKAFPDPWHLEKLAKLMETKPEHMVLRDLQSRAKTLNVKP